MKWGDWPNRPTFIAVIILKKNPLLLALLPANFALLTESGQPPQQPVGNPRVD
jgi:hypothetical protein